MQAWKKALAIALGLSLPLPAMAATGVRLEPVEPGAKQVSVRITDAEKGDWYHLYVDDYFIGGRLIRPEAEAGLRIFKLPDNVQVKNGTQVRVEMAKANSSDYLSDRLTVGQKDNHPAPSPAPTPEKPPTRTVGDKLKATYPASARPGERVIPKIFLMDANGVEMDVSASALYSHTGPIAPNTFRNGSFAVDANAKDGDVVRLAIILGQDKVDVEVVVKGQGVSPSPNPPVGQPNQSMLSAESGAVNSAHEVTLATDIPQGATSASLMVRYKDNSAAQVSSELKDVAAFLKTGKGALAMFANQAGGVSYSLLFKDAAGKIIKDVPFGYYFGTNPLGNGQARMTIGLRTMRVGSHFATLDQAPFIRDHRTFVPLRALAEAFGASVVYNDADQTITIQQGDRQLRMTIGKKEYQVGGKTQTVDVAPYLTAGGRTMVPVRFAAEGLGYGLDVRFDGNGLTDHIIFKRA